MEILRDIIGITASLITIFIFIEKILKKIRIKKLDENTIEVIQLYGLVIMMLVSLILMLLEFVFWGAVTALIPWILYLLSSMFPIKNKRHVIIIVILSFALIINIIAIILYLTGWGILSGILLFSVFILLFISGCTME